MIRLTHILAAMGLVLLAGVLSVHQIEERLGTTSVPGLLVVDCPAWDADVLDALRVRWAGATLEWVEAGPAAFEPFGPGYVGRAAGRGEVAALFSAVATDRTRADVSAWPVVLDVFPGDGAAARARAATTAAARFVEGRTGSRGFVVGLALATDPPAGAASSYVEPLLAALETFPSGRRTTLVVLGRREDDVVAGRSGRRWCLRIPRGEWGRRIRPGLDDLLDDVPSGGPPW